MKKGKIALAICLSVVFVFAAWQPSAQSRTKVYYSGEAVTYGNNLVFATVNTGALELFTLENGSIVRTAMFKPRFISLPKGSDTYHDLQFDVMNGHLYLYLTNGRYLSKYDVSNPYSPRLLEEIKDNAWDWFLQIDMVDDYLITIGTNNIKYWNKNLEVTNTYEVDYQKAENISFSKDGGLIFSLIDNVVEVYDTSERKVITNLWLKTKEEDLRGVYYDLNKKEIYITDDEALKVFDLTGQEVRRFQHSGDFGYDVALSSISNSVYFSDGIGVVRNDKNSLKPVAWAYTTDLGIGHGWAMDIEVVGDSNGDKLVVFNNNDILVLDNDLKLIDYFRATDVDMAPIEALNLKLDKTSGTSGDYLTVSGGGYSINEELEISMGKERWTAVADANGRFSRTINVIDTLKPQVVDIKVDGVQSGLTYSISFNIN